MYDVAQVTEHGDESAQNFVAKLYGAWIQVATLA
jgi:hypothetical protein